MSQADAAEATIVDPIVRDLDDLAVLLAGWLGGRMPQANGIRIEDLRYPLGAGMSHETILFDAAWTEGGEARRQGMVVRIKPTKVFVYQDDMFVEQYRLMEYLHGNSDVRVARTLWFDEDASLLGAPFFVMEKKAGRVAVSYPPYSKSGWLIDDATPADRRRMWEDSVTQLALIQRAAVPDFLAQPGRPTGFDQETDRWRRFMIWVDEAGETQLAEAYDRLMAAGPANRPDGIVWGDARLGNMMIAPDFSVAAVMDWEQPSQGGALHDLGWWLLSEQNYTVNQGIAQLDGMGAREETIALWEKVSGKSAADIDWYIGFAIFKQECLSISTFRNREMPANAVTRMGVPGTRTLAYIGKILG